MKTYVEPQREIPVRSEVDVLVVGGGPSGIMAARAAAKDGAKVLLIESRGYLGGNLTLGLPILAYLDVNGKQCIRGYAQELIDRLAARGCAGPHVPCKLHMSLTIIDPDEVKDVALEMVQERGVEVLMYVFCSGAIMDGNRIKGVVIESKAGREAILAKTVIDCTGDGDVAFRAGVEMHKGDENGGLQPPTLMYSVRKVNVDALRDAIVNHSDEYDMDTMPAWQFNRRYFITVGLRKRIQKATEAGLDIPVARTILITGLKDDQIWVNMSRVSGVDSTRPESYTGGEIEARKQVKVLNRYLREFIPGFENMEVERITPFMGIRESRVMVGKYVLNGVSLTSDSGPALNIVNGKRINFIVSEGSENSFADAAGGTHKAALYVKGHAEWNGAGSVTVKGLTKHAYASEEYTLFEDDFGSLTVTGAVGDGIHVEQYYEQRAGTVIVSGCSGDGIDCGMTNDTTDELNGQVLISGGSLTIINETGTDADGIDSNGDILITGGTVRISLTGSGTNSALDCASESGGVCLISGGSVIACGSYSMAEAFDSASEQCSILYNISQGIAAGTKLALEDAEGTVILEYEVPCSFSSAVISCPEMVLGENYLVVIGDNVEKVTLDETSASFGDAQSSMFGGSMNRGGFIADVSGSMPEMSDMQPSDKTFSEWDVSGGGHMDRNSMKGDSMDGGTMDWDPNETSAEGDAETADWNGTALTEYGSDTWILLAISVIVLAAGIVTAHLYRRK